MYCKTKMLFKEKVRAGKVRAGYVRGNTERVSEPGESNNTRTIPSLRFPSWSPARAQRTVPVARRGLSRAQRTVPVARRGLSRPQRTVPVVPRGLSRDRRTVPSVLPFGSPEFIKKALVRVSWAIVINLPVCYARFVPGPQPGRPWSSIADKHPVFRKCGRKVHASALACPGMFCDQEKGSSVFVRDFPFGITDPEKDMGKIRERYGKDNCKKLRFAEELEKDRQGEMI